MNHLTETGDAPDEAAPQAVTGKHPKFLESDRNPTMEGERPEDFSDTFDKTIPDKMKDAGPDDGTQTDEAKQEKSAEFLSADTLCRLEEAILAGEQLLDHIKESLNEILIVEGTKLPESS